jgi:8-oxo-dGTP diphosphatase
VNECIFETKGKHALFVVFKARVKGGEERITRPHEIAEMKWVEIEEADQLMPTIRAGLQHLLKRNQYPITIKVGGRSAISHVINALTKKLFQIN